MQFPEGIAGLDKGYPRGSIGEPEDIANLCLFLASPYAANITGQVRSNLSERGFSTQPAVCMTPSCVGCCARKISKGSGGCEGVGIITHSQCCVAVDCAACRISAVTVGSWRWAAGTITSATNPTPSNGDASFHVRGVLSFEFFCVGMQ